MPFLDLLLVTISFLLITAVWTSIGRLPTSAVGEGRAHREPAPQHVVRAEIVDDGRAMKLAWQRGLAVDEIGTVPLAGGAFAETVAKIHASGIATGRIGEEALGNVILRVPAAIRMKAITEVIDVFAAPAGDGRPRFFVTLSTS